MEALKPSSRPLSPLLRRAVSGIGRMASSRSGRENIRPEHPNVQADRPASPSISKKASDRADRLAKPQESPQLEGPGVGSVDPADPSVKVVVRVRPVNGQQREASQIVRKVSADSLAVGDRMFTFNSVLGPESTQDDVFKLVGIPLVKNSLAGFNTSIVSYGQTGSGKSYTMWGPPSAMVDGNSINSYQGIVPRIFHMLFSDINKNQQNSEEKQVNYLCRCSFLEIHNEEINDLLDPTQRNLQIRDDGRNGFHVENLTDEYVTTVEDVTQVLVKGLSNRKVGATSINSKSSRSHVVFTCIIDSWCKGSTANCFSSSKTSRICFIDLAGSDRDELDGVSKSCIKEERHIKKSLSKLGRLVNILAEASHTGGEQNIPYTGSTSTHILQEAVGGNVKVTFICAISPDVRCKAGTLSTLRFGKRAKNIQNKAMINEITEADVNGLSDQIRQLKEELIRTKSYEGKSVATAGGHFKGHNARESLKLLRVSLNRSLILPGIDSEEEVDIAEDDVTELCAELSNLHSSCEDDLEDISDKKNTMNITPSVEVSNAEVDSSMCSDMSSSSNHEHDIRSFTEQTGLDEVHCETKNDQLRGSLRKSSLLIIPCKPMLQDPIKCSSPKIDSSLKKSMVSSGPLASKTNASEIQRSTAHIESYQKYDVIRSSLQSSKVSPTESLAASLHKGLQIIDYHHRSSDARSSFVGLSFEHLTSRSYQAVDKADAGMQTLADTGGTTASFFCVACKKELVADGSKLVDGELDMQTVPASDKGITEGNDKIPVNTAERLMELEALCAEQAVTIKHLNFLVDQYKQGDIVNNERNQDAAYLTDGVMEVELKNERHMHLNHNCEDISQLLQAKSSLKDTQNEQDHDDKNSFDPSNGEALGEIQTLRNQLKSHANVSTDVSLLEQIRNGSSHSMENGGEEFEGERQRWLESESKWISLTDELRLDLESSRRLAEKKEIELGLEKKCTAELDDALHRSILGHARIIEHYVELQEKHNDLLQRHRKVMEGIAEVKKAAAKAGGKGSGSAFAAALAAELSTVRIDREKERAYLKEQNRKLRLQLRDTAEAVHAAGELLVRMREAEEAVSLTEEKYGRAQQEIEKLRKQMEKMKKKHAMELVTMKHFLAESRLPESALEPMYYDESEIGKDTRTLLPDDDQAWRAAFKPAYQ